MCGIAGSVRADGAAPPADAAAVRAMCDALAHRGPDGAGLAVLGPAVLGHRRLAVIDLTDAAAQPMSDASGRFHITYNGEIYDYVELRAELAARGVALRTHSDTEALLEGYALWGPRVLERLNGMFAFAIWDAREETLFAARDRCGEKPFFYVHEPGGAHERGGRFVFASEPKALRAAGLRSDADPAVLFRYLAYRHTGTHDDTFYAHVRQLPPGHELRLRGGRLDVRRWWTLPDEPEPRRGGDAERVEELAALLADAVRLRLRSDVPVGSCLSGGIDSSAVVALVAAELRAGRVGPATTRQLTFTASFPGAPADETAHARAVAAAAAVEPHEVAPSAEELASVLPRLVFHQDEPFSGPSIFAEWKVMELARDRGVTVLLNGQGADEVFAGYPFYFGDMWVGMLRAGRLGALRRSMRAHDALHGRGLARRLLRENLRGRLPHALRELRGGPRVPWLHADFVASVETAPPPRASDLRGSLRESQRLRMLPHLLRQADRSSMAFSREVRLPFLDHRLLLLADALPDDMKLRGGVTKWALREAVRGLVPETVLARRDKVGFGVPTAAWMRGALAEPLRATLDSERLRTRGIYDLRGLDEVRARFDAGDDTAAPVLFTAWIAETWLRTCVDAAA